MPERTAAFTKPLCDVTDRFSSQLVTYGRFVPPGRFQTSLPDEALHLVFNTGSVFTLIRFPADLVPFATWIRRRLVAFMQKENVVKFMKTSGTSGSGSRLCLDQEMTRDPLPPSPLVLSLKERCDTSSAHLLQVH